MKKTNFIPRSRLSIPKGFSALTQLTKTVESFPDTQILKTKGESFSIIIQLKPTPASRLYEVKIDFNKYDGVKVFVINERLKVAKNREKLPHVYSHSKQQLCLYSVSQKEWSREKLIVSTIIPWTCDWLFYYELWLPNGRWFGGGHDEYREN